MSAHAYADEGFVMVDLGLDRDRFPVVGLPVDQARALADQIVEAACRVERQPLSGAAAVAEVTGGRRS